MKRAATSLPSRRRYESSLEAAVGWLLRSLEDGDRGSSAYFSLWGGWAKPYPETTGYVIPTLLDYARHSGRSALRETAVNLGDWLIAIQQEEGYWYGMFHPPRTPEPSVFNTAQILLGLCALSRETEEERWLEAAERGAGWLAEGVDEMGTWPAGGHYRTGHQPTYYTRVAWPMLEVAECTGREDVRDAAGRVLHYALQERRDDGSFRNWAFQLGRPAFTHTIAYTLRGLIESARLLDEWPTMGQPVEDALHRLWRLAELRQGRLPGAFEDGWKPVDYYTCLTGNAQVALCLLRWGGQTPDLRLLNGACKLVDNVCDGQVGAHHPFALLRGAVPGSRPLWGRYLTFRYPNWAAKFHCDALMALLQILAEVEKTSESEETRKESREVEEP